MNSPALCLFLLAGTTLGARNNDNPVTKVVELITDLKAKIEAEGKDEQKTYDKFACWCEKTTARKAAAIEEAKTSIEKLSEKVLSLKGSTGKLKAEIQGLNKDIASNNQATKEATGIREKETRDYNSQKDNLEQAIGALEGAIKTLEGAGEFTQTSALQKTQFLSAVAGVRGALRVIPSDAFTRGQEDKMLVEDFVHNPMSFYSQEHKKLGALEVKGVGGGTYAPASTQIQGLLKGMYDAMVSDLESKNADQAIAQKNYEELMSTKAGELETLQSSLATKTTNLGDDTKELSESTIERDETTTQLEDDTAFFEKAKQTCRTQANNWAIRSKLRSEELAGIEKAHGILTSDEASETFGRATSMLLQSIQKHSAKSPKKDAAYMALKNVARKHHSLRMGAMATMIQTSTEGHFDIVIESVDKMLAELRQEEQDDIDLRDYCQDEENKVENEVEDLEHRITNIQGLIDRLNSKKKDLNADIKQTESDIQATEDAMAEALSMRNEENEEFKAALKDDEKAIEILGSAIEAMAEFGNNNKAAIGLVQKKMTFKAPEYEENAMPDTVVDANYGGERSAKGGGIDSILGYIKEDLENEVKTCKAAEGKSQSDFEGQRSAATKTLNALNSKKVSLETTVAETEEKLADATEDKEMQQTTKENKQKYRDSLKPKCDWMKESFDNRRSKRREEMDGLLQAKASLAGGGAGFIQKGSLRGASTDSLVEAHPWIL